MTAVKLHLNFGVVTSVMFRGGNPNLCNNSEKHFATVYSYKVSQGIHDYMVTTEIRPKPTFSSKDRTKFIPETASSLHRQLWACHGTTRIHYLLILIPSSKI